MSTCVPQAAAALALTLVAGPGTVAHAQCPASGDGVISQSLDLTTIDPGLTPACTSGGMTSPGGWARCFVADEENVPTPVSIGSVSFTVEEATQDAILVNVNLFVDANGCRNGPNAPGEDLTQVGTEQIAVNQSDVMDIVPAIFDPPVVWPDGCDLWIEIEQVEDGTQRGFAFRPGSNGADVDGGGCDGAGQCSPSYLRGPECGFGGFVDMAAIGSPCAHLIMVATFTPEGVAECPEPPLCGNPEGGDCCAANGTPGCNNAECCDEICGMDAFCCNVQWDFACAMMALELCGSCFSCDPGCLPEDTDEGEVCGDDTNGGCNSQVPVYGPNPCGLEICGTAWAEGGARDSDWYAFSTGEGLTDVSATINSEFPSQLFLVAGLETCVPLVMAPLGHADLCTPGAGVQASLPQGEYAFFVTTGLPNFIGIFDGYPCGNLSSYRLVVNCEGPPPPPDCEGDTDGDNVVGVADLIDVITLWGTDGQAPGVDADLNDDGVVGVPDLIIVITNWGDC